MASYALDCLRVFGNTLIVCEIVYLGSFVVELWQHG